MTDTIQLLWLFLVILLLIGCYYLFLRAKKYRRRQLEQQPLPAEWKAILDRNVPLYKLLPDNLKNELYGHINVFLDEKQFEGCAGLEITDEIRVTVAAFACILLLNRKTDYYPGFQSILVYPWTFISTETSWQGVVQVVKDQARLGESWHRGPIVLSWDSVMHGALDIKDGHNVVLHEFAHKLDEEDSPGQLDGTPKLGQRSRYVSWGRVMQKEYDDLRKKADRGSESVLDYYGATNPAEFFAVLTETFFEKPSQLKRKHPELYEETRKFYKMDPVSWGVD